MSVVCSRDRKWSGWSDGFDVGVTSGFPETLTLNEPSSLSLYRSQMVWSKMASPPTNESEHECFDMLSNATTMNMQMLQGAGTVGFLLPFLLLLTMSVWPRRALMLTFSLVTLVIFAMMNDGEHSLHLLLNAMDAISIVSGGASRSGVRKRRRGSRGGGGAHPG